MRGALNEEPEDTIGLLETCADAACTEGLAQPGDRIGITAGVPRGVKGGSNLFNVRTIE